VEAPSAAQIAEQVWQKLGVAQQLVEDVCIGSSGAVECLAGAEVLGAVQEVVGHRLVGLALEHLFSCPSVKISPSSQLGG
jgi:hypothetical protein